MKTLICILTLFVVFNNSPVNADEIHPAYKAKNWAFHRLGETKLIMNLGGTDSMDGCEDAKQVAVNRFLDEYGYAMRSCEALGGYMTCNGITRTRGSNGRFTCEPDITTSGGTRYYHVISAWCTCNPPRDTQARLYLPTNSRDQVSGSSFVNCKDASATAMSAMNKAEKTARTYTYGGRIANVMMLKVQKKAASPYECRRGVDGSFVATGEIFVSAQVNSKFVKQHRASYNDFENINRVPSTPVRPTPIRPVLNPRIPRIPVRVDGRRPIIFR